jgi:eukaryotic-like serine/threonine-protein kinase
MPLPQPFAEKYEILETIAQGGMGAVYRVRHRLTDDLRVLKVLRSPVEPTPAVAAPFPSEAWKASRLRHSHLAILYDYALTDDGRAVLVLENVAGLSLREILRRFGTPPLAVTLEIGRQVCRALAALHQQHILHSDLSLGSLMLAPDFDGWPLVKLIDRGLAKSLEGSGEALSTGGVFVGKLRYAAPERFGSAEVDERSDLYALGIVLYELLTGHSPFTGHDPRSWMAAHLFGTPLDFAASDPEGQVPDDLRALVLRALARDPEERMASADDFGEALDAIQERYPLVGDELAPIFGPEPAQEAVPEPVMAAPVLTELAEDAAEASEEPPLDWAAAPFSRSGWEDGGRAGEGTGEGAHLLWEPAAEEPAGAAAVPVVPLVPALPPRRRAPFLPAALPVAVMLVLALFVFLKGRPWWNPQVQEGPPVPLVATPEPAAKPAPATTLAQALPPSPPPAAAPSPSPSPVVEEAGAGDEAPVPDQEVAADQVAEEPGDVQDVPMAPEAAPEKAPEPAPAPAEVPAEAKPARRAERRPEPAKAPQRLPSRPLKPLPRPSLTPPPGEAKAAVRLAQAGPMRRGDLIQPGPGVSAPVPLEMPRFNYPAAARGQAGDMDVRLDLLVDENGKVIDAVVREGDPAGLGFKEAALAAARQVRFQPATRNEIPGKMWTDMIFEFSAGR